MNFTDLDDNKFYCFWLNAPAVMEGTTYLAFQEIMKCGLSTTFPEVGTVTEYFKICIDASSFGREHFDSLMSVHEGDCKYFSGFIGVSFKVNYNYYDATSAATPYGDTFFTQADKAATTVSPKKEGGTSFDLNDRTELAIGFTEKSELSANPITENEISHKPTSFIKSDITDSKDLMDDATVVSDNKTSSYGSNFTSSAVCLKYVVGLYGCAVLYVIFNGNEA